MLFAVSKFKASRTGTSQAPLPTVESEPARGPIPPQPPVLQDMLDQLEVLDEYASRSDQEKYNRLATVSSSIKKIFDALCETLLLGCLPTGLYYEVLTQCRTTTAEERSQTLR